MRLFPLLLFLLLSGILSAQTSSPLDSLLLMAENKVEGYSYSDANLVLSDVLEQAQQSLDKQSIDYANCLYKCGVLYKKMGKQDIAKPLIHEADLIFQPALGGNAMQHKLALETDLQKNVHTTSSGALWWWIGGVGFLIVGGILLMLMNIDHV